MKLTPKQRLFFAAVVASTVMENHPDKEITNKTLSWLKALELKIKIEEAIQEVKISREGTWGGSRIEGKSF